MATVTPRTNANGTTTYKVQVRVRRDGAIVHQETKTFDRRQAAVAWGKKRDSELAAPGALENAKIDDPPLATAIRRFLDQPRLEIGKSKKQALQFIENHEIAKLRCSEVTSTVLVNFGEELGLAPVTVAGYFSHLKTIFKVARPAWGFPLAKSTIVEAVDVLSELGVIGTSARRDRRPTLDEVTRIVRRMYEKWLRNPKSAPYHLIVLYAIFSARRRGEIVRTTVRDVDQAGCRLLVFDMKDPKKKIGNHVWVDMTFEALRILRAVPAACEGKIFDLDANTITIEFHEACVELGIENLRFHDLRHEGVSRLFEMGKSIPEVSMMSGHKTWTHLKRYAHIHAFGDKYASWEWLDIIAPLPQLPLGYTRPQS
ncbi:TPA: site-specific integrase [Burkholderia multivorans]|nr:site-specific integrase [Burkholderia multivorans]